MVDNWQYFKSIRLSQEAPVPIVIPEKEEFVLGGSGNVAKNLDLLGANVYLFSLVGTDKYTDFLINTLIKEESKIKFHYISDSRINTLKKRLIVDNQHFLRIDYENSSEIDGYCQDQLVKNIANILKLQRFDAIILQDYNKGLLTYKSIDNIKLQSQNKIRIYTDPKKYKNFSGSWLLKPNKKEFFEISSIDVNKQNYELLEKDIFNWMQEKTIYNLLITLSEQGMLIYDFRKKVTYYDEKFINGNTVDVTGAGDIVIALYTALDLLITPSSYEKLAYTTLAAQTAITKRGTSTINVEEILKNI
jgi:rfaE bifunctional protein kinase chain/domain